MHTRKRVCMYTRVVPTVAPTFFPTLLSHSSSSSSSLERKLPCTHMSLLEQISSALVNFVSVNPVSFHTNTTCVYACMRIHHVALRQTGRLFFILSRPGLFTLSTVITRIPASSELLGTSPLPIPNPLPRFSFPLGNFSRDRVWGIPTFPRILIIF